MTSFLSRYPPIWTKLLAPITRNRTADHRQPQTVDRVAYAATRHVSDGSNCTNGRPITDQNSCPYSAPGYRYQVQNIDL